MRDGCTATEVDQFFVVAIKIASDKKDVVLKF